MEEKQEVSAAGKASQGRPGRTVETISAADTMEFARSMGLTAVPGQVICLYGDLGAGKTVFAKGFAEGLGIREQVCSPTFTILQVYEGGRLPLYHFDAYRLEDADEMEEIGWEEYAFGDGVTLVEWPSRIEEIIPDSAIRIKLDRDPGKGMDYRRITLE